MKKTLWLTALLITASSAFGDALLLSTNNPTGSGNWNAAHFFSTAGGYLNPGNTGLGNGTPVQSMGFYWRYTGGGGSNAERHFTSDANTTISAEGTNSQRDDFVEGANNLEQGSPQVTYRVDYRLRPVSTTAAVLYMDWKITNTSASVRSLRWYALADLCSRTTAFGNTSNDNVTFTPKQTLFSAGGANPNIYFSSSRSLDNFEVSKVTSGSDPDCRIKMQNGLSSDSLANAVVGSGVGNWAAVYQYDLTLNPGQSESGTVAIGYNSIPAFDSTVSGTIDLGPLSGSATYPIPVTVEIRNVGDVTPVETKTVNVASDGSYSFTTGLSGTYDIAVKGDHWLRKLNGSVNIPSGGALTQNFALINGDVDGSNGTTTDDYLILSLNFDTEQTPGTNGDLDRDGVITTDDYLILSNNFDIEGDV